MDRLFVDRVSLDQIVDAFSIMWWMTLKYRTAVLSARPRTPVSRWYQRCTAIPSTSRTNFRPTSDRIPSTMLFSRLLKPSCFRSVFSNDRSIQSAAFQTAGRRSSLFTKSASIHATTEFENRPPESSQILRSNRTCIHLLK